ncbi:MAG: serine--tRNA ligase [Alphaproteobacteria bacterium]
MLDLKWIRENPALLDVALQNRNYLPVSEEVLSLDQKHRNLLTEIQKLQAQRNVFAKSIAEAKKQQLSAVHLIDESSAIRDQLVSLETEEADVSAALKALLETLPNMPSSDVPVGKNENSNIDVRTWGPVPHFSFTPISHEILGERLGGMDFEQASQISGARFCLLKGQLALLERALASFMLDTHTQEFGYEEISPPYVVREEAVYGVGQLPKFAADLFATTDRRWLISTGEVSLTNLVREKILDGAELPLRYVAYTPCFRSEAGAAGKDTKGMIRLHQFSKVELVHVCAPESSEQEHAFLLKAAETILQKLELPYRVMLLCTGDMGFASQKTYDLEVWLPSQETYREISSCSNCGDFQARRMKARFRRPGEKPLYEVHTLNGSGLAVGRTLVAVLENYQQADGSILIPKVLQPYMRGQERIAKR